MKTYISIGRNYIANIVVDGVPQFIRFRDMGQYQNRGVYITNNKAIAEGLEKSPRFNECFFLENGEIEEVKEVPTRVYDATYMVKRTQDAIRILVDKHGVESGTIKNREGVLAKADELNILFPNL